MRRYWPLFTVAIVVVLLAGINLWPGSAAAPSADFASPTPVWSTTSPPLAKLLPTLAAKATLTPVDDPSPSTVDPSDDDMLKTILNTELPPRDLYALTERTKLKSDVDIPKVVNADSIEYQVGRQDTFFVTDAAGEKYHTITATIQVVTPHAYFYVQDGQSFSLSLLQQAADTFEEKTYPEIHRDFGTEWTPGVDNDPHITILNTNIPGLGGYYSAADEYPKCVNSFSNEREMIYVNISALSPSSNSYNATLAHEFQHMVHWAEHPSEDTWVNEGAAVLAQRLAGYGSDAIENNFLANPDTQLNAWDEDPTATLPHYGAAYLFFSYLTERCGGYGVMRDIVAAPGSGITHLDRYLQSHGLSFNGLFADWVVANYLDDTTLADGRYGYQDIDPRVRRVDTYNSQTVKQSGTVHQYAADYVEINPPAIDFEICFDGADTVKVVPNEAHGGERQWWSNRGDVMDTTLTKSFDLSSLDQATLRFWTWYDIEKDFDFAYVMVSGDNGQTWETMKGRYTTVDNPLGTNLGNGFTGESGGGSQPSWVLEEMDLSTYAGRPILVRFEYVTDDAYSGNGFCVDDIVIPELGFSDSVEEATQWEAQGFIQLRNVIPQQFAVTALIKRGAYEVQPILLDAEQKGSLVVRSTGQRPEQVVLVVAAMSPGTTEPANFTLGVLPLAGK